MKLIDLKGKRFEYLTVLEKAPNSPSNGTRWLCKCDCGKEVIVWACSLKKGDTKSCGCMRDSLIGEANTNNLIGKKFGRLEVVNKTYRTNSKNRNIIYWECKCDCGNTTYITTGNLINTGVKSCGCYRKEKTSKIGKNLNKYILMQKQLRWDIDIKYLESFDNIDKLKILNKCLNRAPTYFDKNNYVDYINKFYYDDAFNLIYDRYIKLNKPTYAKPSLDHIVPLSRGGTWELTNLQFLTWAENRAKYNFTQEEWIKIKELF